MRKFFVILMTSLLSASAAFSFFPEGAESSFEIGVGYRSDSLKWGTDIDFEPGIPTPVGLLTNISSESRWKSLNIWQIEAKGRYVTCNDFYIRGSADYGWVTSGKNHNTFSATLNGVEDEFLRFHSKARGHVYDVKFGVGYQFRMCDDSFALSPVIGYSWHGQHLRARDTIVDIDGTSIPLFSSSSSSYYSSYSEGRRFNTRWNGPWLGLDFDYRFCCDWSLFAAYEYHWARYHAKTEIDSFFGDFDYHHHAKRAHGQVALIGIQWDFCDCWTLGLTGQFQWWRTKGGKISSLTDEESFGDIEEVCYLRIPLSPTKWHSAGVTLDIGYLF